MTKARVYWAQIEYTESAGSGTNVAANAESLVITPQAATITLDVDVQAAAESLVITPQAATITFDVDVQAAAESLVLTPQPATISLDIDVQAAAESLVITEYQATVSLDKSVDAATEALTLTTHPATVVGTVNTEVSAATESLVLTTHPASVTLVSDQRQPGGWLPEEIIYLDKDGKPVDLNAVEEAVEEVIEEAQQPKRKKRVKKVSEDVISALEANRRPDQEKLEYLRRQLAGKTQALRAIREAVAAQERDDDEVATILLLAA